MKNKGTFSRVVCIAIMLVMMIPSTVQASTKSTYYAKTMSPNGLVDSQLPYLPDYTITKVGEERLKNPQDIVTDTKNRHLYIADTDNKRIVVSDYEGNFIRIIGEGVLQSPQGICLGLESNSLYVADRVAEKVFKFSTEGELLQEYAIPKEPLFGKNSKFQPIKVAVDIAENIYIVSNGNTNGIIQLSNDGYFLGYFGANKTKTTLLDVMRKKFYSKEQLAKEIKNHPKTPTNLGSDTNGLIYTITQGESNNNNGLKKLNMAGSIIFNNYVDPIATDVTISNNGSIYVISQDGFIIEYAKDGGMLFVFGGKDDGTSRVGLFTNATGITFDENEKLYVLDSSKNEIQVFKPSDFKMTFIPAFDLYYNGHYAESREPWMQVLGQNRVFQYAYRGLGEAEFKLGNYDAAMEAYYQGGYKTGYSDSFWQIRNQWLNHNIITCAFILLLIFVFNKIFRFTKKKYGYFHKVDEVIERIGSIKLCRELRYLGAFIKHPIDSYYGIRFQHKTSLLSATILYFISFIIYIVNKYFAGYIFKEAEEGYFNVMFDLFSVGGLVLFLVICNYLVSTIREGEGSLKVVYMSVAYTFMPYIIIKPILFVLTHVLTLNEMVILDIGNSVINIWTFILIFLMITEIHNYSFSGAVKNILITLVTALVMAIIIFIIYLMFNQLVDFVYSLVKEVMYRAGY
jgi:sugar lactone lactonase YvrE